MGGYSLHHVRSMPGSGEIDSRVYRLYEYLAENPDDMDIHLELLECVRLRDGDEGVMASHWSGSVQKEPEELSGSGWSIRFTIPGHHVVFEV